MVADLLREMAKTWLDVISEFSSSIQWIDDENSDITNYRQNVGITHAFKCSDCSTPFISLIPDITNKINFHSDLLYRGSTVRITIALERLTADQLVHTTVMTMTRCLCPNQTASTRDGSSVIFWLRPRPRLFSDQCAWNIGDEYLPLHNMDTCETSSLYLSFTASSRNSNSSSISSKNTLSSTPVIAVADNTSIIVQLQQLQYQ